jgi:hypothetical protein
MNVEVGHLIELDLRRVRPEVLPCGVLTFDAPGAAGGREREFQDDVVGALRQPPGQVTRADRRHRRGRPPRHQRRGLTAADAGQFAEFRRTRAALTGGRTL